MTDRIYMPGLEFITKIVIAGERNFSHIKLEEGFDFSADKDALETFKAYLLKNKHLYHDPLIISNSEFSQVYFNLHSVILSNVKGEKYEFLSGFIWGSLFL